jgi:hypothetical protein
MRLSVVVARRALPIPCAHFSLTDRKMSFWADFLQAALSMLVGQCTICCGSHLAHFRGLGSQDTINSL